MSLEKPKRLVALERKIQHGLETFIETGEALFEIRHDELWDKEEYPTFEAYCFGRWGFKKSRAYQLMFAAETAKTLPGPLPITETQVRPLAALPPQERASAYQEAVKQSGGEAPSPQIVEKVVEARAKKLSAIAKRKISTLVESGFSKEDVAPETKLGKAMINIAKVVEPAFMKALKDGTIKMRQTDIIEMSKLKTDALLETEHLLASNGWNYKKARAFLSKMPTPKTKVEDLINLTIAAGGKYEADILGYHFVITAKKSR